MKQHSLNWIGLFGSPISTHACHHRSHAGVLSSDGRKMIPDVLNMNGQNVQTIKGELKYICVTSLSLSHTHTLLTLIHKHILIETHTLSLSHTNTGTHSHALTHSNTYSYAGGYTSTNTLFHSLSLSFTHTLTHKYSLSLFFVHTRTFAMFPSHCPLVYWES